MKSSAIVLTAAFLAVLAIFPWSFGAFAGFQNEVDGPVTVGWEIRAGGPAASLLASGTPLVQHPGYAAFQQQVINEIIAQVPSDVRNAWPFQRLEVDPEGHLPEEGVRGYLQSKIDQLNQRRDEIAAAAQLPNPPDFSLTTGMPDAVEYTYWNDTKDCQHKYLLSVGGVPWELTDSSIPATAVFTIAMSWQNRIEAQ